MQDKCLIFTVQKQSNVFKDNIWKVKCGANAIFNYFNYQGHTGVSNFVVHFLSQNSALSKLYFL